MIKENITIIKKDIPMVMFKNVCTKRALLISNRQDLLLRNVNYIVTKQCSLENNHRYRPKCIPVLKKSTALKYNKMKLCFSYKVAHCYETMARTIA